MDNGHRNYFISIVSGSYPYGTAATIRNITFLKGLKELNYNISLFVLYPDKNQDPNSNKLNGEYNQIPFYYTTNNLKYQKNKIKQYLTLLLSVLHCNKMIRKRYNKRNTIILNQISNPFISFILTILLKKKCKLYLHEVTEFPFVRKHGGSLAKYIYNKLIVPKFDKVFVISSALKTYFNKIITPQKVEILNMFVDLNRFRISHDPVYQFDYIAYCGTMNTDKDGVPILIEAFHFVKRHYPNLKLVLIGDNKSRPVHKDILRKIEKYQLQDSIIFSGHINAKHIPRYLIGAKILALARPDNIQAKGGFPTKLGEYLATGKPVVVTKVGDIPNFIQDGINGYLSEPNSKEFANKIIDVLRNYNMAVKIGEAGKKLAEKEFNYQIEAAKVANYIEADIRDYYNEH